MADEHWAPVREWHRVVNERDLAAARTTVTDEVAVGGPRGAAKGVETFVSWIESAGIHLLPVSWHPVSDETVIVEHTRHGRPDRMPMGPLLRSSLPCSFS